MLKYVMKKLCIDNDNLFNRKYQMITCLVNDNLLKEKVPDNLFKRKYQITCLRESTK